MHAMKVSLRNKNPYYLSVCFVFFVLACSRHEIMTPEEFFNYCNTEQSGLVKERKFNNILYKVRLVVPECLALQEGKPKTEMEFRTRLGEMNNQINFVLLLEDDGPIMGQVRKAVFDKSRYGEILSYSNTLLQQDFELKTSNGEIIPSSLVHIESANSTQPVLRISGTFRIKSEILREGVSLKFDDNIFLSGPVNFYFDKTVFQQLPSIRI